MPEPGGPTQAAIAAGCRFLLAGQDRDGYWRDYALAPGPSSDWVTAVVGSALAAAGAADGGAVARALAAARANCRPAGWGYNRAVATDADTTAWMVRWHARTGADLPLEPLACLQAYLGPEGGATTFAADPRYGCWTHQHVDVTAVLGLALHAAGAPGAALAGIRRWLLAQRDG